LVCKPTHRHTQTQMISTKHRFISHLHILYRNNVQEGSYVDILSDKYFYILSSSVHDKISCIPYSSFNTILTFTLGLHNGLILSRIVTEVLCIFMSIAFYNHAHPFGFIGPNNVW
jgi:hypothetical protein